MRADEKDRNVTLLGEYLYNKDIALLVTGSIAAYKAPSIAIHLRQYGAEVTAYITKNALNYIGKMALENTTRNNVISELSKDAEHLSEYDSYVVAPADLNTINKMANGEADNAVTTTLAVGLGRLQDNETKVIIAPAMHGDMYKNPALKKNIKFLEDVGVKFVGPHFKEGKANLADTHSIIVYTIREMSEDPLKDKDILITAGPTYGKIDNVRAITNIFRGRTGIDIADEAFMRGANVKLIYGPGGLEVPKYLDTTRVKYFEEMYDKVMKEIDNKNYDVGIFSAAITDYIPERVVDGKISSKNAMNEIKLKGTPKIIKKVREKCPEMYMTTFKLENNISVEELLEIGKERLKEGYEIVVANRLEDMSDKMHESYIMSQKGVTKTKTKRETTKQLLNIIGKNF